MTTKNPALRLVTARRQIPRLAGVASPPPDTGLQVERTSLSWARTWAVLAVDITLVIKLVAETSLLAATSVSGVLVIPLLALVRIQPRHEERVHRFLLTRDAARIEMLANAGLVAFVVVMALVGLAAVLHKEFA